MATSANRTVRSLLQALRDCSVVEAQRACARISTIREPALYTRIFDGCQLTEDGQITANDTFRGAGRSHPGLVMAFVMLLAEAPRGARLHPSLRREKIATLWLADLGLSVLPSQIGGFRRLRVLGLAGNGLTALPPELFGLTELRVLALSRNHLQTLPREVGQLARLRVLDVDRNRLEQLPTTLGQLAGLRVLWAQGNRLTALPPEVRRMGGLVDVDLRENPLMQREQLVAALTRSAPEAQIRR